MARRIQNPTEENFAGKIIKRAQETALYYRAHRWFSSYSTVFCLAGPAMMESIINCMIVAGKKSCKFYIAESDSETYATQQGIVQREGFEHSRLDHQNRDVFGWIFEKLHSARSMTRLMLDLDLCCTMATFSKSCMKQLTEAVMLAHDIGNKELVIALTTCNRGISKGHREFTRDNVLGKLNKRFKSIGYSIEYLDNYPYRDHNGSEMTTDCWFLRRK